MVNAEQQETPSPLEALGFTTEQAAGLQKGIDRATKEIVNGAGGALKNLVVAKMGSALVGRVGSLVRQAAEVAWPSTTITTPGLSPESLLESLPIPEGLPIPDNFLSLIPQLAPQLTGRTIMIENPAVRAISTLTDIAQTAVFLGFVLAAIPAGKRAAEGALKLAQTHFVIWRKSTLEVGKEALKKQLERMAEGRSD